MSEDPLSKLPPDVARELRRHISPKPLKKMVSPQHQQHQQQQQLIQKTIQQQAKRGGNTSSSLVLAGCIIFTAGAFSIPFIAQKWIGNLNARDEPLTHSQIRRGAFNNSGSRDAGKDPEYDFTKGQYKYKKDDNYWKSFENNKETQQAFGGATVIVNGNNSSSSSSSSSK